MSPIHPTPEYQLLRLMAEYSASGVRIYDKRNMLCVNDIALKTLTNAGHCHVEDGFAHITTAGYSRLEELENAN